MQKTPEDLYEVHFNDFTPHTRYVAHRHKDVVIDMIRKATADLATTNQLLLEEINRMNAIIEKQGKVIQALRDV